MRYPQMTVEQIPDLPGYTSIARAAKVYGLSKGAFYYMIYHQKLFSKVYKVSKGEDDQRPLILIDSEELKQVMDARAASVPVLDVRAQELAAWTYRVKDWGVAVGWSQTRIVPSGPPSKLLINAYLAKHPHDQRPE